MSNVTKFFVAFLALPLLSFGQDPIFTQFHNVPEALNPAFTASANTWNAGLLHRRQWPNENRRIDTQYAFLSNLATDELGLGMTVQNHNEVFTGYRYLKVNGAASYRIDISYDWRLRFGMEAGYGQKDFGFGGLLLEDQINTNTGAIEGPSVDPWLLQNNKISFFDLTVGALADTDDAWIGASLRHLTRPDISFNENGNVPLDLFLSVHGGYFWELGGLPSFFFPDGSEVMIMANYMRQSEYNRLDIGSVMDYGLFTIGAFAAVNVERRTDSAHFLTSVNPVATLNWGEFKLGYSLDINTSGIGRTGGVHELTLVWQSSRQCDKCDNYKVRLKRNNVAGYVKG
jgi:type IX secretion system PorP/SprF family membrane protein